MFFASPSVGKWRNYDTGFVRFNPVAGIHEGTLTGNIHPSHPDRAIAQSKFLADAALIAGAGITANGYAILL